MLSGIIHVGKSIGFRKERDLELTVGLAGALDRDDQPGSLRLRCEDKRDYEADENCSDHWFGLFPIGGQSLQMRRLLPKMVGQSFRIRHSTSKGGFYKVTTLHAVYAQ